MRDTGLSVRRYSASTFGSIVPDARHWETRGRLVGGLVQRRVQRFRRWLALLQQIVQRVPEGADIAGSTLPVGAARGRADRDDLKAAVAREGAWNTAEPRRRRVDSRQDWLSRVRDARRTPEPRRPPSTRSLQQRQRSASRRNDDRLGLAVVRFAFLDQLIGCVLTCLDRIGSCRPHSNVLAV